MEVINLCSGDDRIWGPTTAIYVNCFVSVGRIGTVEFAHCPREANKVAHEIANESFISNNSCNGIDDPPAFLLDLLVRNVILFYNK
jgi:hypothetical protein